MKHAACVALVVAVAACSAPTRQFYPVTDVADVPIMVDAMQDVPVVDVVDIPDVPPMYDPPRQIAPLSTATVTSRQPTLHWILASDTDGAHVQICHDRACTMEVTSFDALGPHGAPPTQLPAGVVFWRVTSRVAGTTVGSPSPSWEMIVGARTALHSDTSWGTVLDVNADGYADVVVGAPGVRKAYLYYGSATGIPTAPSSTLASSQNDSFGFSVASAGDVNGDGFADLIVGAPDAAPGAGRAYLFLGSAAGVLTTPMAVLVGPDGAGGQFGYTVASAGDLNGDGYADLLIGAPGVNTATGAAYAYTSAPTGMPMTPPVTMRPPGTGVHFGVSVSSAGDVNGDGVADVVVGADQAASNSGGCFVYLGMIGHPITFSRMFVAAPSGGGFGLSVANAGDIDADGYSEIIVGTGGAGLAYVLRGTSTGTEASPSWSVPAAADIPEHFGWSVAGAGDVNGDGFADIIAGAFTANSAAGKAFVTFGSTFGVNGVDMTLVSPAGASGMFGWSVAGAGDANRDGFDDLIVGADTATPTMGRAFLYRGSSSPPAMPSASVTLVGPDGGSFGTSVAIRSGAHRRNTTQMAPRARGARTHGSHCGG